MRRLFILAALCAFLPFQSLRAEDEPSFVKLPLAEYKSLLENIRLGEKSPDKAPAGFAFGQANVQVKVITAAARSAADVSVKINVKILESKWTAVPLLPAGTALKSATVNGQPAELLSTPQGIHWAVNQAGSYSLLLNYSVDTIRSNGGSTLALPLPQTSAASLSAVLPGIARDVSLLPSAGVSVDANREGTTVTATLPSASGVQLSWRAAGDESYAVSRAAYNGELKGDAINWNAELSVELFNDSAVSISLLPETETLSDVRVDGKPSAINLSEDVSPDRTFTTRVQGKGMHTIALEFQTPVTKNNGPSQVEMRVPQVPVNKISLQLPGKKEITVTPAANVTRREEKDSTFATIFSPMTSSLSLQWTEAVPEEIKTEIRINSSIYHTVFAEEGVLFTRALADLEITRGESNLAEFEVPKDVQIGKVSSPQNIIADWRVQNAEADKPAILSVYFDRAVKGEFQLDISYDRSINGKEKVSAFQIPLLRAKNVHRQRGMIALLASKEATFKTVEENDLTRVGENQIPPNVRQNIDKIIAHSFKYAETPPKLMVELTKPEKQQGKFDANVNTLVSLSDVTVRGSASVDIHVKSGNISELDLEMPPQVNFLSLNAPSMRTQKLVEESGKHILHIEFTQDMEGEFRAEVAYEQIVTDANSDVGVPTLLVRGAEVEQGQIAVEALSAVEVLPAKAEQLSSVDPSELPQQLILKTTNPILLAYKYAHVSPPYSLGLRIKRHKEIEVQAATIDQAIYRTLITKDGFALTSAHFNVRNSRQQFLRVELPAQSKVWLALVDGKPEKPAMADAEESKGAAGRPGILVKIINSTQGFPVDLIYQTPTSELGQMGILRAVLPRPDMIAAETHWDLFLPQDMSYGRPDSNMNIERAPQYVSKQAMEYEVKRFAEDAAVNAAVQPLRFNVPVAGVRYSFNKLYANQTAGDAYVTIPYSSGGGTFFVASLVMFLALAFWTAALGFHKTRNRSDLSRGLLCAAAAAALVGYYGADFRPLIVGTVFFGISLLVSRKSAARKVAQPEPEYTSGPEA